MSAPMPERCRGLGVYGVYGGEARRKRGVIGKRRPRNAEVDFGMFDRETAYVNAVQAQHRAARRETASRAAGL